MNHCSISYCLNYCSIYYTYITQFLDSYTKSVQFEPCSENTLNIQFPKFVLKISCKREKSGCNRIVVSTSRCGRDNPGSNPGYSILFGCAGTTPNMSFTRFLISFNFYVIQTLLTKGFANQSIAGVLIEKVDC